MANKNNNEVLRRIADALNFDADKITEILSNEGYEAESDLVSKFLTEESNAACPDDVMSYFLDGLISYRRGKKEEETESEPKDIKKITNNTILKKLKIAFDLKSEDMLDIFDLVYFDITKQELTALFRREGHKNYKTCPDNYLINFLKGIKMRYAEE